MKLPVPYELYFLHRGLSDNDAFKKIKKAMIRLDPGNNAYINRPELFIVLQ
jgi:hypothetical protein